MIKVCHTRELPAQTAKVIMVNETPVAVFNSGSKIFAWDNRCPHRGASLGDGYITDKTVQCKYHLWEFDIEKKCAVANEAIKIKSYNVEIIEEEIFIKI